MSAEVGTRGIAGKGFIMGIRQALPALLGLGTIAFAAVLAMPLQTAAQEERAVAPAPVTAQATDAVPMVEIRLDRKVIVGRIVHEDDESIRVEPIGSGAIGYRKAQVDIARRFTISLAEHQEQVGDHHLERATEGDDALANFAKARAALQKALALSSDPAADERLMRKIESVAQGRNDWHEEQMRQQQLAKIQAETELAQIEKQLAVGKMALLAKQEQALDQLSRAAVELERRTELLWTKYEDTQRKVDAIARDMDDFRDDFAQVPRDLASLKRSYERLRADVAALRASAGRTGG